MTSGHRQIEYGSTMQADEVYGSTTTAQENTEAFTDARRSAGDGFRLNAT
jgi:hypothetical protein